jgi:hypothetical protein
MNAAEKYDIKTFKILVNLSQAAESNKASVELEPDKNLVFLRQKKSNSNIIQKLVRC